MNQIRRTTLTTTLLLATLAPTAALAHPGHGIDAGFMAGMAHPLTGLDHVLMIVAVSAWAALLKPAERIGIAACLGAFVAIGALAPWSPVAGSTLEAALALTVIGAGVLLAVGRRWPVWATSSLAALFALIHGFAHGAEGPAASPLYVPGLVVATAGMALMVSFLAAKLPAHRDWPRALGVLSAAAGATALFGN